MIEYEKELKTTFSEKDILEILNKNIKNLNTEISEIEKKKILVEIHKYSKDLFNKKNTYIPEGMEIAENILEYFENIESEECENGYTELNITFFPVYEEPFRADLKNYLHKYDLGYGWIYTYDEKEKKLYVRIEGECN